ncbi:hypothetical protein MO867_12275 [Microbulbifer sp. OS29]|uniref:Curlin associated repeat-containing protein n=1 Tax=Microbulbifer okhotskensis TaxID=2926617 RepID=A0A9X2EST3_9GAMM|nr:hypothetical protein [Microbulbifer okhotskensis]MCO1335108.1 hypothetical protein [Microbulbifer okhotskensis]
MKISFLIAASLALAISSVDSADNNFLTQNQIGIGNTANADKSGSDVSNSQIAQTQIGLNNTTNALQSNIVFNSTVNQNLTSENNDMDAEQIDGAGDIRIIQAQVGSTKLASIQQ